MQVCAEMGHPVSWEESRSLVTLQLIERHANSDLQATQEERDSLSVCMRQRDKDREREV